MQTQSPQYFKSNYTMEVDNGNEHPSDFVDSDYHTCNESDDSPPSDSSSDLDMESVSDEDRGFEYNPTRTLGPGGNDRSSHKPAASFAPKSAMCIVCGVRPQYSQGFRSYPTCGLTCAAKLSANKGSDKGGSTKMCIVCGVRPRYSKGGKSHSTCGLTCAATLHPSKGSGGMCDYCHKRPKFFDGRKTYPQCGRSCRDKSKLAASGRGAVQVSPSAVSSACLMCWRAPRQGDSHFCGRSCAGAAEHRAPLLLEAPRGHVTFKRVVDNFRTSWKSGTPCPDVKKVYKIIEKPAFVAAYDKYRTRINGNGPFQTRGGERHLWFGTTRECNLGDPGNVKPCSSITCSLCSVMRSSFDITSFPNGIPVSDTSNKSDECAKNNIRSPSKAMLLINVVTGKETKMSRDSLPLSAPPRGFDSVRVMGSRNGKPVKLDEVIVYAGDAVRPSYLVVYG